MKAKDAATQLNRKYKRWIDIPEIDLAVLYHDELFRRGGDRWRKGNIPLAGFCTLLKEMNEWIVKVCTGTGMTTYMARKNMHTFNDQAYNSAQKALDKSMYRSSLPYSEV